MFTIYLITNVINGKKYVGKTLQTLTARWKDHVRESTRKRTERYLPRAIKKYKLYCFLIHPIDYADSVEESSRKEIYWIDKYKSFFRLGTGYNMTLGGEGGIGPKHSEETKRRWSAIRKGRKLSESQKIARKASRASFIRFPEGFKEKLAKINKERCTGVSRTAEERAKISAALLEKYKGKNSPRLGMKHTKETRDKMKKAWITRVRVPLTPEQEEKRIQALRNKTVGVPRSEETKAKIRQSWVKRKQKSISLYPPANAELL